MTCDNWGMEVIHSSANAIYSAQSSLQLSFKVLFHCDANWNWLWTIEYVHFRTMCQSDADEGVIPFHCGAKPFKPNYCCFCRYTFDLVFFISGNSCSSIYSCKHVRTHVMDTKYSNKFKFHSTFFVINRFSKSMPVRDWWRVGKCV